MGGKSKLSTYQEQVSHTQRVGRTRPGEKFYVGGQRGPRPSPPLYEIVFYFFKQYSVKSISWSLNFWTQVLSELLNQ